MFSRTTKDPEYPTETGNRNDGQNLVEGWLKNKKVNGHCATTLFNELLERIFLPKTDFSVLLQKAKYVWNKVDFDAVKPSNTDFLMGTK